MALLKFLRGTQAGLVNQSVVDGALYFTTDTHKIFMGTNSGLQEYSAIEVVSSIATLPDIANVIPGKFYYTEAENVFCFVHNGAWQQVNPDTGATTVEVVGEGNAVTAASYDAATRKLTLTKGDTFVKQSDFDTLNQNVTKMGGKVYTVESESTDVAVLASGITAPKQGDVLIATNGLGVKSAYHYDAENGWIACDGMVDATTVILKDNITMAGDYTAIGNLTKTKTGTKIFETAGKSVAAALTEILSKRLQPANPTQPSVSLTFSQAQAYEVGTEVTPSYSASLSAGSYTYGPATGVTASEWTVTDTNGGSATTASGSFAKFTVGDNTNYTITATAKHNAGVVAKDNLGSDSNPVKQIAAGDKSATSGAITGYRSYFYGVLSTTAEQAPLTSAIIRGMTNGGAYDGAKSFTINGSTTAKRIVVAIPSDSNRGGLSEVLLASMANTPITDIYIKTENAVKVEGVNGFTAVDYDVYVYSPEVIGADEVHTITLA